MALHHKICQTIYEDLIGLFLFRLFTNSFWSAIKPIPSISQYSDDPWPATEQNTHCADAQHELPPSATSACAVSTMVHNSGAHSASIVHPYHSRHLRLRSAHWVWPAYQQGWRAELFSISAAISYKSRCTRVCWLCVRFSMNIFCRFSANMGLSLDKFLGWKGQKYGVYQRIVYHMLQFKSV